jgi:hypothetical protein
MAALELIAPVDFPGEHDPRPPLAGGDGPGFQPGARVECDNSHTPVPQTRFINHGMTGAER